VKIFLYYIVALLFKIIEVSSQEYASPLAGGLWFRNIGLAAWFSNSALIKLLSKVPILRWQQPSLGKESVV
jgi:hypothetical protein